MTVIIFYCAKMLRNGIIRDSVKTRQKRESMRLNKYIASCGVCSRREADKLIEAGRILVNGTQPQMGQDVTEEDTVEIDGTPLSGQEQKKVLAYYKPVGVTCSEKDEHAEKLVTDMIRYPVRLTYAGRLDKDSEGLLILTNDGDLIEHMMRASHHHEKEYIVKVNKEITPDFMEKMRSGVYLEELGETTRPCEVKRMGHDIFDIVLTQGLNRQIRRMCAAEHYHVMSLRRIRIMNILLGELQPNAWREITGEELEKLYRMAGMR